MELSQIRYFIMTAQMQNMSKAARTLHITQPTLSKSISSLERELGARLFDRSGKRLILNDQGRQFLERSLASVRELDDATREIRGGIEKASLRLGLMHLSGAFMRSVGDFILTYPDIRLQIEHIMEASDSIDTNRYDLLLYPRGAQFHRYKGQSLFTDTYLLAVSRTSPLAAQDSVSLSDMRGQSIVFIETGKDVFEFPYYVCKSSGLAVESQLVTNSREIQRRLISSGCGVGFVSEGLLDLYENDGGIAVRPFAGEDMRQEIMIGFKRANHLSESGRLLADHILMMYDKKPIFDKGGVR